MTTINSNFNRFPVSSAFVLPICTGSRDESCSYLPWTSNQGPVHRVPLSQAKLKKIVESQLRGKGGTPWSCLGWFRKTWFSGSCDLTFMRPKIADTRTICITGLELRPPGEASDPRNAKFRLKGFLIAVFVTSVRVWFPNHPVSSPMAKSIP